MTDRASERRVLVVAFEGADLLGIASVVTTLQAANHIAGLPLYRPEVASPGGQPIRTAGGQVLHADSCLERVRGPWDTVVVSGGVGYVDAVQDPRLVAHVRRLAQESRRVSSVCTGSGLLAAAGLLDGRRAAAHWEHAESLSRRFPRVCFDKEPILVRERDVYTAAGSTAAVDLALAFVEADEGPELARAVARSLVVYLQRSESQPQISIFTAPAPVSSSVVRRLVAHVCAHPGRTWSTHTLADLAGVSERHLSRLFLRDLGLTPAQYVRKVRVEAAAGLLTSSDLPLDAIARRCGFGSVEALRQSFRAMRGVSPSVYRAAYRAEQAHT